MSETTASLPPPESVAFAARYSLSLATSSPPAAYKPDPDELRKMESAAGVDLPPHIQL
jgi:hypothetical protein